MANPKWGTKRTCPGCDARFYDMKKQPVTCPSCDTEIEIQVAKPRRPVAAVAKVAAAPVAAEAKADDTTEDDIEIVGLEDVVLDVDDEDEDDLIEDTSDLDEDDGLGEVKEHMETDVSDDN